MIHFVENQQYC